MRLRTEIAAWVGALGLCCGLLVHEARRDGLTNDEILYLTAGQLLVQNGDYRVNPSHPPLAVALIGLGLATGGFETPPLGVPGDVLAYCRRFVFEANDPSRVILAGRLPVIVCALCLVALAGLWGRQAGGPIAGLVALALVAFHPSILAHGHLATTDVPAALFALAAAFAFERWLARPHASRAVSFGVLLGLGLATRLTVGLLVPALGISLLVALVRRPSGYAVRPQHLGGLAAALLLVPLVIWGTYGLRDRSWPEGLWRTPKASGPIVDAADFLARGRLLPNAYVDGVRFQVEHARKGHPAYLMGERSRTGFALYGPVAFGVKNTPGYLLATLMLLVLGLLRARSWDPGNVLLGASAASVFLALSLGSVQIGERYLLAMYAPLALLIARLAEDAASIRWVRSVVASCLLLHVAPALLQLPSGYLPYFNFVAGGTSGGHRYLLDSSLDWGQDLPRLAEWMRRQNVARVELAYHGVDDPARLRIARDDLPGLTLYPVDSSKAPFGGVVVVSPNLLFGLVGRSGEPYASLRLRAPDARAGVFFVYRQLDSPHPQAR